MKNNTFRILFFLGCAVFCLAAIAFFIGSPKPPAPGPKKPRQCAVPEEIIKVWEKVALDSGVREESINRVAAILKDAPNFPSTHASAQKLGPYEESLGYFCRNFSFALEFPDTGAEKGIRGTEYWLAFCILNAFVREAIPDADAHDVRAYYEGLVDRIVGVLAARARDELPPAEYKRLSALVEEGLEKFRKETKRRIGIYSRDFLCPGLRRKLFAKQEARLIAFYHKPETFIRFKNAQSPMFLTDSEVFQRKFKHYIEDQIGSFLYRLFIYSLRPEIKRTIFWGKLDCRAYSIHDRVLAEPTQWPACIGMVPKSVENNEHADTWEDTQ